VDLQSITPVTQSFADRNSSSKLQSDAEHKAAELTDAEPTKAELTDAELKEAELKDAELKEAFTDFVGQTLFGSMLASMRKTVGKPAYMHGGRTEEVFQQQLDQKIVEELAENSASEISDPMFELFKMGRTP
jgi:flagellar protein FlgJ